VFFIDIERIEGLSVPFQHPVMPFMPRLKHGFEKLHEAVPAAYVLGRAAPRAIYECGIVNIGLAVAHALDDDVVNPVVAEIIDIFEPIDAAINQGFQAEAFGSINLALIENIVGIGFAINLVADPELEQVRVTPSHRHLNDFVQRDQGRRRRDVGASPYPRLRVPKLNQYPGDRLNHRVLGARPGVRISWVRHFRRQSRQNCDLKPSE